MQGGPLIVLTPAQLHALVLGAVRLALGEQWVSDAVVAKQIGCTVRVWRDRYHKDDVLLKLSINRAPAGQRAQRRWRVVDVVAYLKERNEL